MQRNLNGLNGWLIVVGIGVVAAPIILVAKFIPLYGQVFTSGVWTAISTPEGLHYNPKLAILIGSEVFFNTLITTISLYLIYLFFSKKKLFPKLYIYLSAFSLLFLIIDGLSYLYIFPEEPFFDKETIKSLSQLSINILIWVPYMCFSKRVKLTFVN